MSIRITTVTARLVKLPLQCGHSGSEHAQSGFCNFVLLIVLFFLSFVVGLLADNLFCRFQIDPRVNCFVVYESDPLFGENIEKRFAAGRYRRYFEPLGIILFCHTVAMWRKAPLACDSRQGIANGFASHKRR